MISVTERVIPVAILLYLIICLVNNSQEYIYSTIYIIMQVPNLGGGGGGLSPQSPPGVYTLALYYVGGP